MSEFVQFYFEVACLIIGRIIYGKEFHKQSSVPLYIKAIAGLLPVIVLALVLWVVLGLMEV